MKKNLNKPPCLGGLIDKDSGRLMSSSEYKAQGKHLASTHGTCEQNVNMGYLI